MLSQRIKQSVGNYLLPMKRPMALYRKISGHCRVVGTFGRLSIQVTIFKCEYESLDIKSIIFFYDQVVASSIIHLNFGI